LKIGVLGVQGDIREHMETLRSMGVDVEIVKKSEQLDGIDGLIIPGGESTTISKLMKFAGLWDVLKDMVSKGFPIFGTCAGMIVLSKRVTNNPSQETLGVIDIDVERNAYGRQVNSFEVDLEIKGVDVPIRGVFIRAPRIVRMGSEVEVLAVHNGTPVFVRQGRIMVASFHPELSGSSHVHRIFLETMR